MRSLVIGATSGLGRSLSYALAMNKHDLILVSSDKRDLIPLSKHLSYLYKVKVQYIEVDAANFNFFKKIFFKKLLEHKNLKYVFFPMGISFNDDDIKISSDRVDKLIKVNFETIVLVCNFILTNPAFSELQTIVGFGSIASTRARKNNIIYTASKSALKSYFQSLKHAFADKINIQFYLPGYLFSQQSMYKKLIFKPASTDKFAALVIRNLNKNFEFKYFPLYWFFISFLIKMIPWRVFKKINF
jgi:short-subunit dehydrogenase